MAARWTTACGARERPPARLAVANVRPQDLDPGGLLLGRDVLLTVHQRVEHANLAAGLAQLRGQQRADIAASSGDQGPLGQVHAIRIARPRHAGRAIEIRRGQARRAGIL